MRAPGEGCRNLYSPPRHSRLCGKRNVVERKRAHRGGAAAPSEAWAHRVLSIILQVVSVLFQQLSAVRASRSSKKIVERERGYRGGAAAPSKAWTHRVLSPPHTMKKD